MSHEKFNRDIALRFALDVVLHDPRIPYSGLCRHLGLANKSGLFLVHPVHRRKLHSPIRRPDDDDVRREHLHLL